MHWIANPENREFKSHSLLQFRSVRIANAHINNSMNYFEYLDYLPPVSLELQTEAKHSILNRASTFVDPKFATYQVYVLQGKIKEFTKSIFDFEHGVSVQVIKNGAPVHVDIGRRVAYNYIIETGGSDVLTSYFNIDDFIQDRNNRHLRLFPKLDCPPAEPLYSVCIEPNRWHKLNVSLPHTVLNIESERIAITVTPLPLRYRQGNGILRKRFKSQVY